jgi:hypothetical protein
MAAKTISSTISFALYWHFAKYCSRHIAALRISKNRLVTVECDPACWSMSARWEGWVFFCVNQRKYHLESRKDQQSSEGADLGPN